jgi:hypothetical protein
MTETTAATTLWDEIAEKAPTLSAVRLSALTHTAKKAWAEIKDSNSEALSEAIRKMLMDEEWVPFSKRATDELLQAYDADQLRNFCSILSLTYKLSSSSKKSLAERLVHHYLNERASEAKSYLDRVSSHARHLSSMRWLRERLDERFRKIAQEEGESFARDYRSMEVGEASRQAVRQCARYYAELRGDGVPDPLNAEKGKYADDVQAAVKATLQFALNALLRTDLINNKSSAVQTRLQDLTRQVGYLNGYRWVVNACGYLAGQDTDYSYPHITT